MDIMEAKDWIMRGRAGRCDAVIMVWESEISIPSSVGYYNISSRSAEMNTLHTL